MTSPHRSSGADRRALVIGASGLVGSHLLRAFQGGWQVTGTYFRNPVPGLARLDIQDPQATLDLVRELDPRAILLPAAEPHVDCCEAHPETTRKLNVEGTRAVVEAARRVGATLAYFSSDYVFDGESPPYAEDAPCCPLNEYGRQKVAAEEAVRSLERHLVLRVSGVYGWETSRKNYVMRVIDLLGSGARMPAWTDQKLAPTWAANIADVTRELVENGAVGTFHVCGGRSMVRIEFARLICRVFGLDAALLDPVQGTRPARPYTVRPRDSSLSIEKVRTVTKTRLLPPEEGLAGMKATGPGSEQESYDSRQGGE